MLSPRQGNWGLKCVAAQDRALKLYPAYASTFTGKNHRNHYKPPYPISTLPEHLHSTFPSHAKLPENTLTEKKNIPFPSLTLITCLTGPPVTPPPVLNC